MTEEKHEEYMRRCIELGIRAGENGSTAVGSLIAKDDVIIAEGIEGSEDLPASLAHAEILAIIKAMKYTGGNDLSNCVLYTTKEPCFMCSYLIRHTRIKQVVFGAKTEGTGGVSSGFPILTVSDITKWHSPPAIIGGIMEEECLRILNK